MTYPANPNPNRITQPLWEFRCDCLALEPGSGDQDGGIYANKPGYHNDRAANDPTNYSVRDAPDKLGPSDKAAAWDWTFASAQNGDYSRIAIYGRRMLAAWETQDPRANVLREFLGQTDTDKAPEGLDFRYHTKRTPDATHEWHDHFSVVRAYVAVKGAFEGVLSILKGETLEAYLARGGRLYKIDGTGEMETDDMFTEEDRNRLTNVYIGMFQGGPSCGRVVGEKSLAPPRYGNSLFQQLGYLCDKVDAIQEAVNKLAAGGLPPADLEGIKVGLAGVKADTSTLLASAKAAASTLQ